MSKIIFTTFFLIACVHLQTVFLSGEDGMLVQSQLNSEWVPVDATTFQAIDVQQPVDVQPPANPTDPVAPPAPQEQGTGTDVVPITPEEESRLQKILADAQFWTGFTQSFLLITLAEIGDRTFILVTIYSSKLKSNRLLLFILGVIATAITQIIAGLIGAIFPFLLSRLLTEIICVVMFSGYGFYMVYDALCHEEHHEREEERKEIEQQINEHSSYVASFEAENKKAPFLARNEYLLYIFMLMCQEWGDKSQFVTISLAANYGVYSIILGGIIAHVICIVLALALGMCVEKTLSEKAVNMIGGILFLCFAVYELVFNIILYQEAN